MAAGWVILLGQAHGCFSKHDVSNLHLQRQFNLWRLVQAHGYFSEHETWQTHIYTSSSIYGFQ